jgi:hypothetical protein
MTPDIHLRRKPDKMQNTLKIYKSGQVTQSGLDDFQGKIAYEKMTKILYKYREQISCTREPHRLTYIPCEPVPVVEPVAELVPVAESVVKPVPVVEHELLPGVYLGANVDTVDTGKNE